MEGERLLLCDVCGADIEEGEMYYKLGETVCADCVAQAETVRSDEANYKVVAVEPI